MSTTLNPKARPGAVRALIVDDSVIARDLMSYWLGECDFVAEVRTARDGIEALAMVDKAMPDVVVLDLHMPRMNGFELLPILLQRNPRLAMLVASRQANPGTAAALRCLELGAADVLAKPGSGPASRDANAFRAELVERVRALAQPTSAPRRPVPPRAPVVRPRNLHSHVAAIVIGASTGGHQAVAAFLKGLGAMANTVPILIAQHMPSAFASVFAEHLGRSTGLDIVDAVDGIVVEPGRILSARGGSHLGVARAGGRVIARVEPGDPSGELSPSVDRLFTSAASVWRSGTRCVVLSGMGRDGLAGARAIAEAGGTVLAQNRESAVVWGMPGAVVEAGLAGHIDTPAGLARRLVAACTVGRAA